MATKTSQRVPSLTEVLRTAAAEVTGQSVPGMIRGESHERNLAGARSMSLMDSKFGNMTRKAQANTTYTAPNFYTPFTQPQAFQVPTNRKEQYIWAQWIYDNEPIIAAGIDFYSDFPLSGFKLECPTPYVNSFYDKLNKKLNVTSLLPQIAHHYYLHGDVILFATIDCPKCQGLGGFISGETCDHEGATIKHVDILNPDFIEITPGFGGMPATYYYTPDETLVKVVKEQQPREQYNAIPEALRPIILMGQPIKLATESIWHLKHGNSAFAPYGTSIIRRLMGTYAYKDKLRTAQWLIAERHILPIKLVKIGSDARPASEEDLDSMQDELANVAIDPLLTIVTHHEVDFDFVGANSKILPITTELEQVEGEFINGLSLNKALINGDGPSYSNAQVGLLALNKRLDQIRNQVGFWLSERIYRPIAEWNGFTQRGDRGEEDFVYPTIKWDDAQLRDNTGIIQTLADLFKNKLLSAQTMYEALEIDYDQEVERLRYENAASMINSPGTIAGLGSLGGGAGSGYGAAPMPGMPGMGGGGGMPGMPSGGPSPVGAPGMGAPPMPAMASVADPAAAYRFASSVIQEIYDEQTEMYGARTGTRLASVQIKSAAHKAYLESETLVTGRGRVGPLPEMPEEMFALIPPGPGYTMFTFPFNAYAMREYNNSLADNRTVTAKVGDVTQQPLQLFTSWEQKLYNLITMQNIPFAIYAQWQAGPNNKYQLDAAIPSLKLGIEADSRKFHANPEDVMRDKRRDMELATQGWTILRFTEEEIDDKAHEVVKVVFDAVRRLANPSGSLSL